MNIDLEPSEALIVLGALQDKQLAASHLAAISDGDEHEIADLASKILGRVATRIVDELYPEEPPVDLRREDLIAEIEFGLT